MGMFDKFPLHLNFKDEVPIRCYFYGKGVLTGITLMAIVFLFVLVPFVYVFMILGE